MENFLLTIRLLILGMLFCENFSQISMKVGPSVQGFNPLPVVTKSKSLWVRVPPVTMGPNAQIKNKKGLAPQQSNNNMKVNNLRDFRITDPHTNMTKTFSS